MPARGISDIGSLRLPISNIGGLVEGMIGQNRSEGMWIRLQDSLTGFWSDVKTSMHNRLHRGQAVREFLHAVKEVSADAYHAAKIQPGAQESHSHMSP